MWKIGSLLIAGAAALKGDSFSSLVQQGDIPFHVAQQSLIAQEVAEQSLVEQGQKWGAMDRANQRVWNAAEQRDDAQYRANNADWQAENSWTWAQYNRKKSESYRLQNIANRKSWQTEDAKWSRNRVYNGSWNAYSKPWMWAYPSGTNWSWNWNRGYWRPGHRWTSPSTGWVRYTWPSDKWDYDDAHYYNWRYSNLNDWKIVRLSGTGWVRRSYGYNT